MLFSWVHSDQFLKIRLRICLISNMNRKSFWDYPRLKSLSSIWTKCSSWTFSQWTLALSNLTIALQRHTIKSSESKRLYHGWAMFNSLRNDLLSTSNHLPVMFRFVGNFMNSSVAFIAIFRIRCNPTRHTEHSRLCVSTSFTQISWLWMKITFEIIFMSNITYLS